MGIAEAHMLTLDLKPNSKNFSSHPSKHFLLCPRLFLFSLYFILPVTENDISLSKHGVSRTLQKMRIKSEKKKAANSSSNSAISKLITRLKAKDSIVARSKRSVKHHELSVGSDERQR